VAATVIGGNRMAHRGGFGMGGAAMANVRRRGGRSERLGIASFLRKPAPPSSRCLTPRVWQRLASRAATLAAAAINRRRELSPVSQAKYTWWTAAKMKGSGG